MARLYPLPAGPSPLKVSYSYRADSSGTKNDRGVRPEKIRVGFISHHFRSHTIGHLMLGLMAAISRAKFSVTILSIGEHRDEIAESIRDCADAFEILPPDVARARP